MSIDKCVDKTLEEEAEKKTNRDRALAAVKLYMANDWNLKTETPEYFLLTKNGASLMGHVLIFIFFGWWTLGITNLAYWIIQRKTKKVIK